MRLFYFLASEEGYDKDKLLQYFKDNSKIRMYKTKEDACRVSAIVTASLKGYKPVLVEVDADVTESDFANFKTFMLIDNKDLLTAYFIDTARCTLIKASFSAPEEIVFTEKSEAQQQAASTQDINRLNELLSEKATDDQLSDADYADIGRVVVAIGGRKTLGQLIDVKAQEQNPLAQIPRAPRI